MRGKHVLRCLSSAQKFHDSSSGESEFMAATWWQYWLGSKGEAEAFWQQFGLDLETDSSAAKDVAAGRGVGEDTSSSHAQ